MVALISNIARRPRLLELGMQDAAFPKNKLRGIDWSQYRAVLERLLKARKKGDDEAWCW